MRGKFKILLSDKIVKRSIYGSLLFFFLGCVYLAIIFTSLPPLVPVFNQLPWGVERLADRIMIFVPLLLAGIIFLFNIIFSQLMYEKMPLVIRMIGITTFFISFSTFIFIIRTTLLVL